MRTWLLLVGTLLLTALVTVTVPVAFWAYIYHRWFWTSLLAPRSWKRATKGGWSTGGASASTGTSATTTGCSPVCTGSESQM